MEFVRASGFEEFVRHYLARERRKGGRNADLSMLTDDALGKEIRMMHPSKLRPWFVAARWSIVSLVTLQDAMALVCVDNWELRKNKLINGTDSNCRLAGAIVTAARENTYFDNEEVMGCNSVESHFRQERIDAFRRQWPALRGAERLILCSLNSDEKADSPNGTWYLHDGFGRLLPWLYCIVFEGRPFQPVEAFCAEESAAD